MNTLIDEKIDKLSFVRYIKKKKCNNKEVIFKQY